MTATKFSPEEIKDLVAAGIQTDTFEFYRYSSYRKTGKSHVEARDQIVHERKDNPYAEVMRTAKGIVHGEDE